MRALRIAPDTTVTDLVGVVRADPRRAHEGVHLARDLCPCRLVGQVVVGQAVHPGYEGGDGRGESATPSRWSCRGGRP